MNDVLIFALLFSAVAIGWLLGTRGALARARVDTAETPGEYYKGLNYLLDGRSDDESDAFIDALEVNKDTLETHLALGNLLRNRGEVDRAIRVHQNLLARPGLPRKQVHLAHLELSRDYISAGLLDRAERLLLDLVEESPERRAVGRRYLLEIYQSEREWQLAVEVASKISQRQGPLRGGGAEEVSEGKQPVAVALAHFYCELASEKMAAADLRGARKLLQQALASDGLCARASIMLGELELKAGNCKEAITVLRRVKEQDADFLCETIETARNCYRQMDDDKSMQEYLRDCLNTTGSTRVLIALVDVISEKRGEQAAAEFLSQRLAGQPSLRGLSRLIHLQRHEVDGNSTSSLHLLQVLVDRLIGERALYRCCHCGFSGQHLHWFCPGCKFWGTIKAIGSDSCE